MAQHQGQGTFPFEQFADVELVVIQVYITPAYRAYQLADHLLGNPRFAEALFRGMRGMGRLWQAAGTVQTVLRPGLLELAGMRRGCQLRETTPPIGVESAATPRHRRATTEGRG